MYGLTIEPGTPLHQDYTKGKLSKCDEELEREMFLHGKATLESAGYEHYEISNYAKPGYSARHNQHYWDGSPYLGLGPAAHSFVNGVRWWNVRDLSAYCRAWEENTSAVAGKEVLTALQRRAETIILGLRQRQGIDLKAWEKTFAESPMSLFSSAMDKLGGYATDNLPFANAPSSQLLTCHDGRLALTTQGVLLYDLVCKELYDVCC
jgi:oxygen-independent coproporphyrinogen-3 oxidase